MFLGSLIPVIEHTRQKRNYPEYEKAVPVGTYPSSLLCGGKSTPTYAGVSPIRGRGRGVDNRVSGVNIRWPALNQSPEMPSSTHPPYAGAQAGSTGKNTSSTPRLFVKSVSDGIKRAHSPSRHSLLPISLLRWPHNAESAHFPWQEGAF